MGLAFWAMRARFVVISLVCAALTVPMTQPAAADRTIKVKDNFFTPVYIVSLGEQFSWTLESDDQHTITSYPESPVAFDSSPATTSVCDDGNPLTQEDCLEPGDTFGPETFTELGLYPYRCKVHGGIDDRPDAKASAQSQPCGMCGLIKVVEDKEPGGSTATRRPRPSKQTVVRPTRSPSASTSASVSPTPSLDGRPVASGDEGSGAGGRVLIAFLLVSALSGVGFWTWRKYLA